MITDEQVIELFYEFTKENPEIYFGMSDLEKDMHRCIFQMAHRFASEHYQKLSALDPVTLYEKLERERLINEELQRKLDETERELHQQRFNNKHNLSIDQKVSNEIEELQKKITELRSINQSEALLNTSLYRENRELQKRLDEAVKVIESHNQFFLDMRGVHMRMNDGKKIGGPWDWMFEQAREFLENNGGNK